MLLHPSLKDSQIPGRFKVQEYVNEKYKKSVDDLKAAFQVRVTSQLLAIADAKPRTLLARSHSHWTSGLIATCAVSWRFLHTGYSACPCPHRPAKHSSTRTTCGTISLAFTIYLAVIQARTFVQRS
jgi:hypothetical protein